MGASSTGEALTGIYQKEKDPTLKRTIIQALFVQGNAEALVAWPGRRPTSRPRKPSSSSCR